MLDDLITATTAHGLQLHPQKQLSFPHDIKRQKNNTVAVSRMTIEILPPDGKTKYHGQLITFTNAVQDEFDHRTKFVWAAFTSH